MFVNVAASIVINSVVVSIYATIVPVGAATLCVVALAPKPLMTFKLCT